MDILRTPDECFANLPGYPYEPNYTDFLQGGRGEILARIVSDFVRASAS